MVRHKNVTISALASKVTDDLTVISPGLGVKLFSENNKMGQ
jgi:hypothetical protein